MRREMATTRRSLSPERREAAREQIGRRILAMPEYEHASRVLAYVALEDEASLEDVLRDVLASGRGLLLPRMGGDGLVFVAIRGLGTLRAGRFGVLEPDDGPSEKLEVGDLALVPGVAFDRAGGRLGRGGGYYDRSLPRATSSPLVFGVGYADQLVDAVPMGRHDRRVDGIVTDAGIVRVDPRDRSRDPG